MNALITCGRHDQWARYMTGGWYTDAIQYDDYMVETQEDERDIRFLFWNPTRPCIAMVIDKSDKVAVIDSIEYSPRCTIHGNMKRGEDTRKMIQTALQILKDHGAKKVVLSDNSYILCDGKKVRLGLMSFFKTGQTWYEKHFGFRPETKYHERYERMKKIHLGVSEKPCSYFTEEVMDELVAKTGFVFFYRMSWEHDI